MKSPKDSLPPAVMYSVYGFTRDDAALQSLEQRLRAAEVDTADDLAHVKEFLDGSKDQQNQSSINASLKRSADAAATLVGTGGVTAAVALDNQVDERLALESNGGAIDADKVVALAEQANQLAPSQATYGRLDAAYLYRACLALRRSEPAFDEFCNKYKRSIGTTYLMAVAASEPGPLQQKVLGNPDTQKVIALMRADTSVFPEGASIYEWAMLKNADAKAADNIAAELRKRPREVIEQSISGMLNPVSADQALDTYWLGQILGKPDDGRAAVQKVAAMGIPIPIQP